MQPIEENKLAATEPGLITAVSSWSELFSDLLGDIMGRLCLTDQARFHAVCKSWRHVYPINKSHAVFKPEGLEGASLLSWFVRVDRKIRQSNNITLEVSLYAPCHSIHDPISVHTISLSELGIPEPSSWNDRSIFCKNDWLFISVNHGHKLYFILFSPLTKTLRQLPRCLNSSLWCFEQSFSSDPESADCVFLLVDTCSYYGKFIIATYGKDDIEWTVRQVTKVQNFICFSCKPMYFGGIFYIVSPTGQVASYNVVTREIIFESLSIDDDLAKNFAHPRLYNLLMVNGELMYISAYKANTCVKRFDRSNKVWIPVSSLLDSAIVDNEKSHSVPNMIEIFNSGCLICSLESAEFSQLMPHSPRFIFGSGNLFFWMKPPLIV